MTTRWKRLWVYAGVLLMMFLIMIGTVVVRMWTRGGAQNIRIHTETTFITEPIDESGRVDYLAALNQHSAAGVSPDKNAAVAMLRAFGPKDLNVYLRPRYYAELGIEPLSLEGDYFQSISKFADRLDALTGQTATSETTGSADNRVSPGRNGTSVKADLESQMHDCMTKPWTPASHPLVEAWLVENLEPLRWIVDATGCDRYYMPLLTHEKQGAFLALLPTVKHQRDAAYMLCVRASRSWGEGDIDSALQDCVRTIRLARLQSQSPTLICTLVAYAMQSMGCKSLEKIAATPQVTPRQLRRTLEQIEQLPNMAPVWQQIDRGERFLHLSAVTMVADVGLPALEQIGLAAPLSESRIHGIVSSAVDWNLVLKNGNQLYDEFVTAFRQPDFQLTREAVDRFDNRLRHAANRTNVGSVFAIATMVGRSQMMSDVITQLLLPSGEGMYKSKYGSEMLMELTKLSLWLALYRQEQGGYPTTLSQMVPDYIDAVPIDVFDGLPVKYRSSGKGYVLYSIGIDQKDDGGVPMDETPDGDIVISVDRLRDENAPNLSPLSPPSP